jgi:hypothetical protein
MKKVSKTIYESPVSENYGITDYHDFLHPGSTKEDRQRFNAGDIYINAAKCHNCNWFVRSRNRHDMRSCRCGNVSVDGGSHYAKRSYKSRAEYTDIIVVFDDVKKEGLDV